MLRHEATVGGRRGETAPRAATDHPQSSTVYGTGATPDTILLDECYFESWNADGIYFSMHTDPLSGQAFASKMQTKALLRSEALALASIQKEAMAESKWSYRIVRLVLWVGPDNVRHAATQLPEQVEFGDFVARQRVSAEESTSA